MNQYFLFLVPPKNFYRRKSLEKNSSSVAFSRKSNRVIFTLESNTFPMYHRKKNRSFSRIAERNNATEFTNQSPSPVCPLSVSRLDCNLVTTVVHRRSPRVRDLNLQTIHVRSVTAYVTTNGRRHCNPPLRCCIPFLDHGGHAMSACHHWQTMRLQKHRPDSLRSAIARRTSILSLSLSSSIRRYARTHTHTCTQRQAPPLSANTPPLRSTVRASRSERKYARIEICLLPRFIFLVHLHSTSNARG